MHTYSKDQVAQRRELQPTGRQPSWIALTVGILLLAGATTLGVVVTSRGAASTGELEFDVGLSHHRDLLGIALSESISTLMGPVIGSLLVVAVCIVLWRRHAGRTAVLLGGLTASGWLASGVLKIVVHRDRPPTDVVNAVLSETASDSFPSGHTTLVAAAVAAAVVIAWMLGRPFRQRLVIAAVGVVAVGVVGAARLYLGVHYYWDVLGAPLTAIGGVLIAAYLLPRLITFVQRPRSRPSPRPHAAPPSGSSGWASSGARRGTR